MDAPPMMGPVSVCERGGAGLGGACLTEPVLMYRVDRGMAMARSGVMAPALSHALQCAAVQAALGIAKNRVNSVAVV